MRLGTPLSLALTALLTVSCLGQGERMASHRPTGLSTMPAAGSPATGAPRFDEYVAATTKRLEEALAQARPNLAPAERERLAQTRGPFEWPPDPPEWGALPDRCPAAKSSTGILLIHGLTDTPFLMRDIGRHFRERHCFQVRAILLPGHGTVPGDLLEVTYQQWIDAARYGIESFAGEVDHLYIAGFSTGGTLAVYHALTREESRPARPSLRGLILFSPAIQVADALAPLANWHKIYSWAIPRGDWIGKLFDEHDDVKYESFPKNAGDQIYLLTKKIEVGPGRGRLDIPVFIALSQDDATVDSRATIEFFRTITDGRDSKNTLIAYTTVPEAIGERGRIQDRISVYPGEGIIAFSHVSIPVRPDNPHYGRHGTYKSCLEYEKADDERAADEQICAQRKAGRTSSGESARGDHRWCRCLEGRPPADGVRLGETSAAALAALDAASTLKGLEPPLVLRRLTFNPDFDGMMAAVDAFVQRVEREAR